MNLEFALDRTVLVCAQRSTVFRYFTDSKRFAAWWGEGSSIEPRPGGAVRIVYPGGSVASGEVLEIEEPSRIVFTYGYEDPARPIRPGDSRVTITLEDREGGTLVSLRHEVEGAKTRDLHVPGWRYQLALFANVVAREQLAGAAGTIDRYFLAWAETDAEERGALLRESTAKGVVFRDAFGAVCGQEDLAAHIEASRLHMPGAALARDGEPRMCQGTALVAWVARGADGAPRARGENVIDFAPDGRIARVVGFWSAAPG
jgi:uncharacterized protein YndB with AHSA1/START domain